MQEHTVLAVDSHSIAQGGADMRKQLTSRIDGLKACLDAVIVMFVIFAVDGREPLYWYLAGACALIELGAVIAEHMCRR